MKNLKVQKRNLLQLQDRALGFCIDVDNDIIYVVKEKLEIIKILTLESLPKLEIVPHNLEYESEFTNISPSDVKLLEFIVESGSILVALRTGKLLRIGVSSFSPPSACVYSHQLNIASAKLSPDQDLIAIADDANDIYMIGLDGELLEKENGLSQNNSLYKPVGVGWGSKETQFFGLDGRPSKEKHQKEQVIASQEELELIDKIESSKNYSRFRSGLERNTVIDWRGDGQFLATLTFIEDARKHYLKVWNRNLKLQYMSEQLVTIERDILTWIPNGHFICCTQKRDKIINEIVMFEKNGLVHQRVALPSTLKNLYAKDILWSPSSRILAVLANQFNVNNEQVQSSSLLMLYTMQNFHYYLKFTTELGQNLDYTIRWNPIDHNRLHVMADDGSYHEYLCNFEVCYSEDKSTVAVIDSNRVLITPLAISNIPPPMAALTLEVDHPIYAIALDYKKATDMYIFSCNDTVTMLSLKLDIESRECSRNIFKFRDIQKYQNFTLVGDKKFLATRALEGKCEIVIVNLTDEVSVKTIANLDHQVVAVASNGFTLVMNDGSVSMFDGSVDQLRPLFRIDLNLKLNFNQLLSIEFQGKTALLSLLQDMTLLYDDKVLLSTSCTSFRVTENYLIYTTTENHLHFLRLDRLWNESYSDTCFQPIEVGATLIIASETDAKVVLQMPRGNLEIIHPRVLIFSALTRLLDSKEFVCAMQMARRHRVNMNFICDYILRTYDIHDFALAVADYSPDMLSLFLTELDKDDTIVGRYENIMKHLPSRNVIIGQKPILDSGKVQKVCTSINLPNDYKYLQPTLLCHLKQAPKKVREALQLVHKLDKQLHREALGFMLYFIDIDQLFLDALRTYNTDIALMVASVSNKDPKAYLALLDEFNAEKDELLRAFKIDMHAKQYGDAFDKLLQHHDLQISQDVKIHDQLRELAASKRIFKQALSSFKSQTKDNKLQEEIWADYGSYLLEKRCYLEAGLAFSKALELRAEEIDYFNKAFDCFSLADKSENTFSLIPKLANKDHNGEHLVARLLGEDKSLEAMVLLVGRMQHDSEYFKKISMNLLDKNRWHLAEYLFPSMRETIAEHIEKLTQSRRSALVDELSLVRQQFDRIMELLKTHKSRVSELHFISDTLSTIDGSEISSAESGFNNRAPVRSSASSIKTRKSSKSSKAEKKKRINLKPGSRNEDLALGLELRKYILRHKSDQDEIMHLLSGLFEYCLSTKLPEDKRAREESERLNGLLVQHFNLRQEISSLLWPDSPSNEQMFSLYRRFSDLLTDEGCTYQTEEFEVLMKPYLPKEPARFEL